MIYFVYGPKEKAIEVKKIIKDIKKKNPNISEKYFDGQMAEETEFLSTVSTNSMFGGRELVVLKRAEAIKKSYSVLANLKNYNMEKKEIIIDYLLEEKKLPKKLEKLFDEIGNIVEVKKDKKGQNIIDLIKNELKCSQKDAQKILEMKGHNVESIYTEIEKLKSYFDGDNFEIKEAKHIISAVPEYNLFEYLEKLFLNKKYIPFLYLVASNIRFYFKLKLFCQEKSITFIPNYQNYMKNSYVKLKEYFREHPFAIYKKLENISKLDKKFLQQKLHDVCEVEYKIKSGAYNDRDGVEKFILEFNIK